jgi:hypothetical protein
MKADDDLQESISGVLVHFERMRLQVVYGIHELQTKTATGNALGVSLALEALYAVAQHMADTVWIVLSKVEPHAPIVEAVFEQCDTVYELAKLALEQSANAAILDPLSPYHDVPGSFMACTPWLNANYKQYAPKIEAILSLRTLRGTVMPTLVLSRVRARA